MKLYFCRLSINFSSFIGVDWLESGCPAISPFFIPQICTHATCAFCKYVHMQLATFCTHWHTQILHKTAMFVGNRQLVVDWRVCFCEDSFVTEGGGDQHSGPRWSETHLLYQPLNIHTHGQCPHQFPLFAKAKDKTSSPLPNLLIKRWQFINCNLLIQWFYYGYASICGELFDIWSFNIWHFHSKLNLSWIAFFHHHPPHNHHHSNISCKTFNEVLGGIWSTGALAPFSKPTFFRSCDNTSVSNRGFWVKWRMTE